MLSVGGIIPSWRYWANPMKIQPLWDLYYATLISERVSDVEVGLTDLRLPDLKGNRSQIPERDIYVHWIMRTADAPEVYMIVDELRQLYPRAVHIAGGTHVDSCSYECEKGKNDIIDPEFLIGKLDVILDSARKINTILHHFENNHLKNKF